MSIADRQLLDLTLRNELNTFIHRTFQTVVSGQTYSRGWYIDAMAWHLQQCAAGNIKRLVITLPPRHLKSICASVAFPAWVLGRDPSQRIICASYSENLAGKHALDCRAVIESDWYRRIFPQTRLSADKNTELNFVTTRQGYRYSTSVGGTLTGRGGNLIIIDDPIKPEEAMSATRRAAVNEWFDRTLYSRLDDKRTDAIVLIMQRLHVEDLVGHVLEKERWTHLNLPAIGEVVQQVAIGPGDRGFYLRTPGELLRPERESQAVLDGIKASIGSFNFSAQYQQCPVPAEGELIKWDWFQFYDQRPPRDDRDTMVQSWDTASKADEISDYSVCTTWLVKDNDYYLLDVLRRKLLYPDLKRLVYEQAIQYAASKIIIEDKGSGIALIQEIRLIGGMPPVIAFNPEVDKVTRMHSQSAKIEGGRVHLPRKAEWLEDFRTEILQFPRGRHDDQVDSLSQFLSWVDAPRGNRVWVEPFPF